MRTKKVLLSRMLLFLGMPVFLACAMGPGCESSAPTEDNSEKAIIRAERAEREQRAADPQR